MNWDAIGAIAELLGAIGVIATLVYLARQIGQNITMVRATGASSYTESLDTVPAVLAQDSEARRVYFQGLKDYQSLTGDEQLQFELLLMLYSNGLIRTFQLNNEGAVAPDVWDHVVRQIDWLVTQAGFRPYWSKWRITMPPEFIDLVEARARSKGSPIAAGSSAPADSA